MTLESARADFPILDQKVHGHPLVYFDNAATAQKPRAVIDALSRFYERDNANVHRGIHELSRRSTEAYEGARARAARFLNARQPAEIIFTRGATEGINLVADTWGVKNLHARRHHSADGNGASQQHRPLADAGGTDRRQPGLSAGHRRRGAAGFARAGGGAGEERSSSLPSPIFPTPSARSIPSPNFAPAPAGAASSPWWTPPKAPGISRWTCRKSAAISSLFPATKSAARPASASSMAGANLLEEMPPFQGGGDMIASVDFFHSTWNTVPHKFEAGTPDFAGAVGLHAAMDYLDALGRENIFRHDQELAAYAVERLSRLKGLRLFGPKSGRAGVVSFLLDKIHAHDFVTAADQYGVALRGGHHCNQPLMRRLRRGFHRPRQLLFLQHPRGSGPPGGGAGEIRKFFGP